MVTDRAPRPVGPYSQAVLHDGWIFVSGQIPLDPATGELVEGDVEAQAERAFANLAAVLAAAGASPADVVRVAVYLTDLSEFARVNEIYARWFAADPPPARTALGVAALPKGARIEIDAIARAPGGGAPTS